MNSDSTPATTALKDAQAERTRSPGALHCWPRPPRGNLRRMLSGLAGVASVALCLQTHAAQLASSTLVFSASGSPQTIAGTWVADPLSVPIGSHIESFFVELTALSSTFGPTSGIYLDNGTIPTDHTGMCFSADHRPPSGCVADDAVGAFASVTALTPVPGWSFLSRLVPGNDDHRTFGTLLVGFRDGGGFATVAGEVRITAIGTLPPVPEPGTFALIFAGMGVLALRLRRC